MRKVGQVTGPARVALSGVVAAVALMLPAASSVLAEDPFVCGGVSPTMVSKVRGITWSGLVTAVDGAAITMRIDHVYANSPPEQPPPTHINAGAEVTLPNDTCNPIGGLRAGQRYVVSTWQLYAIGLSTDETVIWQMEGGRLALVHMYANEFHLPREFAAATTLADAIALVAPGAELPSTDTVDDPSTNDWVVPPEGQLRVNGRGPFIGHLGPFCTPSGCADGPWVTPESGPSVADNAKMTFRVADGSFITSWSVSYAATAELVGPENTLIASDHDVSVKSFSFTGPPAGDWGLGVSVVARDADTLSTGFDAIYFYRVHAGLPGTDAVASPPRGPASITPDLLVLFALAGLLGAIAGWRLEARREGSR